MGNDTPNPKVEQVATAAVALLSLLNLDDLDDTDIQDALDHVDYWLDMMGSDCLAWGREDEQIAAIKQKLEQKKETSSGGQSNADSE